MCSRMYATVYLFLLFSQDRDGTLRVTGEEWLVKKTGAYLPGAYEEVVDTVGAYVLNDKVQCIIVYFLNWAGALPGQALCRATDYSL